MATNAMRRRRNSTLDSYPQHKSPMKITSVNRRRGAASSKASLGFIIASFVIALSIFAITSATRSTSSNLDEFTTDKKLAVADTKPEEMEPVIQQVFETDAVVKVQVPKVPDMEVDTTQMSETDAGMEIDVENLVESTEAFVPDELISIEEESDVLGVTPLTAVPHYIRKIACVDKDQTSVIRAFQLRGFIVHEVSHATSLDKIAVVEKCYNRGGFALLWTHQNINPFAWAKLRPYIRYNHVPEAYYMNSKVHLLEKLRASSNDKDEFIGFVPKSFILPNDRVALGEHLKPGKDSGLDEPWVVKLPNCEGGKGISMFGQNSTAIKILFKLVNMDISTDQMMLNVRHRLIYDQNLKELQVEEKKNQTTDLQQKQARNKFAALQKQTEQAKSSVIVQQYVCDELDYEGRKFDIRIYYLIASARPPIVLYHHGFLRVNPNKYNAHDFNSTKDHLTNLGAFEQDARNIVSFDDWKIPLKKFVEDNPNDFTQDIRDDPLEHIEKQFMNAIASVVASQHDIAFRGYGVEDDVTKMENGFALMGGDFIIDRHLNAWLTEVQEGPGLLHESPWKENFNDELLPSVIEIVEEVTEKQTAGEPVSTIENQGDFRLVYNDEFQYRYSFPRSNKKVLC